MPSLQRRVTTSRLISLMRHSWKQHLLSMLDTEPMLHTAHRCADKVGTYRGCCTPRKMTASPIVTLTPCATPPTSQHDSHSHQPRISHKPMNGTIVSLRAFNTDSDVSMEMDPLTPPGTPADIGF